MQDAFNMDRRAMLSHALLVAGASAAAVAGFTPEALAKAARQQKRFLAASPFAALGAVADTIIPVTDTPGAVAAQVPQKLDAMLSNWAAPATRTMLVEAIARIDAAAKAQKGKAFAALSPEERKALLIAHDKAALTAVPVPPGAKTGNPFAPYVSVADRGYYKLKELMISLYYASEIALTQEQVYEHVPGEWVPSLKITPGMRPFASVGPL